MTNEEIYAQYNAFVTEQLERGVYDIIPHCDSRILHDPKICSYCDRPEWQVKRGELHIAWTGEAPEKGQIPCEADASRPPGKEGDHRRWFGNRPTSVDRDDPSWPEETNASKMMYSSSREGFKNDPFFTWPKSVRAELVAEINRKAEVAIEEGSVEEAGGMFWVADYIENGEWVW